MVKVIVTIDGNIPTKFAHSFNVMKMTQGFSDCGCDTELVTLGTYRTLLNRLKLGPIYKHYGVKKNLKIKFIPVFSLRGLKKAIGIKAFTKKAAKYIAKQKPDLVFCRSYLSAIECVKLNLNTVMETHATNYDNKDLLNVFKISNAPCFRGIVTISNALKEEYVKRGVPENKIIALEDGVDLSNFKISDDKSYWRDKLKLPQDKKIILYSGGLYKEKGIECILKTQRELNRIRGDVITILIGGDKQQVLNWKQYCSDNSINNVLFTGFLTNSSLAPYMKASDVLTMPYDTSIDYKVMDINTTSPLKLFEYMGSLRPIMSSSIPVITKIVEHNKTAMLANENDISSQVEMIVKLLDDKELSVNIASNAYVEAKKYQWKERCREIVSKFVME